MNYLVKLQKKSPFNLTSAISSLELSQCLLAESFIIQIFTLPETSKQLSPVAKVGYQYSRFTPRAANI